MKEWSCSGCGNTILVAPDYEPETCCSGRECGCKGREINPVFCDDCYEQLLNSKEEGN